MKTPNGRVNLIENNNLTKYNLFEETNKNEDHFTAQAIRHIHTDSKVGNVFFSTKNIDALQHGIRYSVYKKTKGSYNIDNQSITELQVIMRSIYLQYCKHQDSNVLCQVRDLNSKVLDYAVPKVLAELNHHMYFVNDISHMPEPLARGEHVSSSGTKFLYRDKL